MTNNFPVHSKIKHIEQVLSNIKHHKSLCIKHILASAVPAKKKLMGNFIFAAGNYSWIRRKVIWVVCYNHSMWWMCERHETESTI